MSIDWDAIANEWQGEQPHPLERGLKIKDFALAVKLASMAKFGGHASPAEAALFFPQFTASGMSPDEFEHALDRLAPLSYTYHGRPPTMHEIAQLKDKQPHEARRYFADLPDKTYGHVTAGEMVKSMRAAEPHAQEHLGRPPVKYEAQYLHHSGEHPRDYYQRIAARDQETETTMPEGNVVQAPFGGDASRRGLEAPRRPQADQRAARG